MIKTSGDLATTWYNYSIATAGTISEETDSEHPAANINKAVESICPKGWTLPSYAEGTSIGPTAASDRYVSVFLPVLGGFYRNGAISNEATRGYWWESEASKAGLRHFLFYDGTKLSSGNYRNYDGRYIRCVQKS